MNKIETFQHQLQTGRISRREFIGRAIAYGATIPAAISMADRAALAAPKSGGTFSQAITGGGTGDTLDPALVLDMYMAMSALASSATA